MAKSKSKTIFVCQNCGAQRPRYEGRCSDCGEWNTYVEETLSSAPTAVAGDRSWLRTEAPKAGSLFTLDQSPAEQHLKRWSTGLSELDRTLGGGLVRGGFVLLGGAPGIGKSTLLMQMAGGLAKNAAKIIYVSAEESVEQTAHRAQRLGVKAKNVAIVAEARMESILALCEAEQPDVLIVDSIQTVYLETLQSAPGSVGQVRESAAQLLTLSKARGVSVFLIGHITKDGGIAGPKVLEHMVDCVLSFEGESTQQFRLLRALKNRFGAAHELGVFEMAGLGLREVSNPSELFLEEKRDSNLGSAVYASVEGTRPLLCEIQALTVASPMANPRRTTLGISQTRVAMLLAVLERHLEIILSNQDVYVNVVGGLDLEDPSSDLAIVAALLSTEGRQELPAKSVFFGEIGLTGEVRATGFAEQRIRESEKLGFQRIFLPASNEKFLKALVQESKMKFHWIRNLREFPGILFSDVKRQ
jgi:DNA repair protein RadA/Sms